jgi:hypothetical protein
MNYINVLQIIEDFANQHPGVKRFKSDTLDRIEDFTNHDEDKSRSSPCLTMKKHGL